MKNNKTKKNLIHYKVLYIPTYKKYILIISETFLYNTKLREESKGFYENIL